jgi:DNA-binding response OmpR family regulator
VRALIIDDSFVELALLQNLLSNANIETEALTSGVNAMNKILDYVPDVILLDLQLPGLSGKDICRQILDNNKTKNIPIIIISSDTTSKTKIAAYRAGGVEYLTKPFECDLVLNAVKQYGSMGEIINLCRSLVN